MMLSKKTFLFISFFLILFSCKKLELDRINKVTTDGVYVLNTTVNASGTIVDVGKEGIVKFGHCWSTSEIPTINDFKFEFENATAGKEFASEITNLSANTTYYICSYATNANETVYGAIEKFTISSFASVSIVSSQLQIQNETSLSINGNIDNLGSLNALDYGHCWATHSAPTIADNKTSNGFLSTSINFSSALTNLSLDTTYYVRAYLKLDNNTIIYSNELIALIPDLVVTTDNFSTSGTTATLQGTIVNLGVLPVIDYGHCWSSLTSNPNINDNVISKGTATSTGVYYANLTGLIPSTTYYYRAYARKGNTLKYGEVKTFTY